MGIKNHLQFGYFKKPEIQEATILYDAVGNEIERVYGDINAFQFDFRNDIVRVVGGTSTVFIDTAAFRYCHNLVSISFPSVENTANSCFFQCSSLSTVQFPKLTDLNLNLFNGCINLVSINLPAAINLYSSAFFNCTKLSSINIPIVSFIDNGTFSGCTSLSTVKLNLSRLNVSNGAFSSSGLTTVRLRPAPNTPPFWTIGSGQTIGGKSGVTVVADWTDWPN